MIHLIILFSGTDVCDIIQLAAVCGERLFNDYTVPVREISNGATNITGFTVCDSRLCRDGVPVPTIPLRDLLIQFLTYLAQFHNPILVAHNARCFDAPVLMRVLAENGLQQDFKQIVHGFLDTLPLSREIYPRLPGYSLEALVNQFLGQHFDAHNAVEDAKVLQRLFYTWKPNEGIVKMYTFSP